MTAFTLDILDYTPITGALLLDEPPVIDQPFPLWRQGHDKELTAPGPSAKSPDRNYRGNASGTARDTGLRSTTESFRLSPDHQTPLDCRWQKLIRDINPDSPAEVVDTVLDHTWAFANKTGLDVPGRRNCRTGAYMGDADATWPAFHAPIVCGGALLSGYEEGGNLHIYSLLTSLPVPTAEYVLSRPFLWFYAVAVNPEGQVTFMTMAGKPVRVPFITRLPVYAPLAWLHRLPPGQTPGPLWMA
jgi:hypothetical protein